MQQACFICMTWPREEPEQKSINLSKKQAEQARL